MRYGSQAALEAGGRTVGGRKAGARKASARLPGMARTLTRFGLTFGLSAGLVFGAWAGTARASHYAVGDIPTLISTDDAAKLTKAGVATTEDLLEKGAKAKDRKALIKASGLKANVVADLVRRADLLRIKGVGPEMVLLLEAAGVKTVADLAKKEAPALTAAADTANKAKKITEKPPTEPQFQDWIDQAKKLPAVIEGK